MALLGKSVSMRQLLHFTRQLSILIGAGTPLIKSLNTVCDQLPEGYFKKVVEDVIKRVEEGSALSAAFNEYPTIFSNFFCQYCKVGGGGRVAPGGIKEGRPLFKQLI